MVVIFVIINITIIIINLCLDSPCLLLTQGIIIVMIKINFVIINILTLLLKDLLASCCLIIINASVLCAYFKT